MAFEEKSDTQEPRHMHDLNALKGAFLEAEMMRTYAMSALARAYCRMYPRSQNEENFQVMFAHGIQYLAGTSHEDFVNLLTGKVKIEEMRDYSNFGMKIGNPSEMDSIRNFFDVMLGCMQKETTNPATGQKTIEQHFIMFEVKNSENYITRNRYWDAIKQLIGYTDAAEYKALSALKANEGSDVKVKSSATQIIGGPLSDRMWNTYLKNMIKEYLTIHEKTDLVVSEGSFSERTMGDLIESFSSELVKILNGIIKEYVTKENPDADKSDVLAFLKSVFNSN